jgi:hypothetical protein
MKMSATFSIIHEPPDPPETVQTSAWALVPPDLDEFPYVFELPTL